MSGNVENPQRNAVQENPHPEVAWWLKYTVKAVGSIAGALAMGCGVWTCLSFKVTCLVAGIFLCLFGFIVIIFETPFCCGFLDFVDKIGKFGDRRPYWQKASIYIIFGIVPAMLCFGLSVIPGAGGIFATGVLYGMMALGRKADREVMAARAGAKDDMKMTLVDNDANTKNSYSGAAK